MVVVIFVVVIVIVFTFSLCRHSSGTTECSLLSPNAIDVFTLILMLVDDLLTDL